MRLLRLSSFLNTISPSGRNILFSKMRINGIRRYAIAIPKKKGSIIFKISLTVSQMLYQRCKIQKNNIELTITRNAVIPQYKYFSSHLYFFKGQVPFPIRIQSVTCSNHSNCLTVHSQCKHRNARFL